MTGSAVSGGLVRTGLNSRLTRITQRNSVSRSGNRSHLFGFLCQNVEPCLVVFGNQKLNFGALLGEIA